jgi:hypothetical protein
MGKRMIAATRVLLLCAVVLVLPIVADGQPAAPSELRVDTYHESYGLWLSWRDNSNNEQGFEIFNGVETRQVGANTFYPGYVYRWGGMNPGQYMCFAVRAYNSAGNSAWEPNVSPWYRCGTTTNDIPNPAAPLHTSIYAGYGYTGAEFNMVGANWWVPRVECPPPWNVAPFLASRAAPWVGLAGQNLNRST